jgi:hypothetical protein
MTKNKNNTKASIEPEHFTDFDAELGRLEETVDSMMERIFELLRKNSSAGPNEKMGGNSFCCSFKNNVQASAKEIS